MNHRGVERLPAVRSMTHVIECITNYYKSDARRAPVRSYSISMPLFSRSHPCHVYWGRSSRASDTPRTSNSSSPTSSSTCTTKVLQRTMLVGVRTRATVQSSRDAFESAARAAPIPRLGPDHSRPARALHSHTLSHKLILALVGEDPPVVGEVNEIFVDRDLSPARGRRGSCM